MKEKDITCSISKTIQKFSLNGQEIEKNSLEVTGKDLKDVQNVFNKIWCDEK